MRISASVVLVSLAAALFIAACGASEKKHAGGKAVEKRSADAKAAPKANHDAKRKKKKREEGEQAVKKQRTRHRKISAPDATKCFVFDADTKKNILVDYKENIFREFGCGLIVSKDRSLTFSTDILPWTGADSCTPLASFKLDEDGTTAGDIMPEVLKELEYFTEEQQKLLLAGDICVCKTNKCNDKAPASIAHQAL